MFNRINLRFKEQPDFERLKGDLVISYGKLPKPNLSYYRLKDFLYFDSILPESVPWTKIPPFQVQVAEIIDPLGGHLMPHIDHSVSSVLNYYIDCADSITHFYKLKNNEKGYFYPGKNSANIFTFEQVEKTSEFIAKDGDAFILNVREIHSVETPKPGKRRFIQWQWAGISYEEVKASLNQNFFYSS